MYDVVVVGLGAMGAAATYQLAKRGARVLGLDRFTPPHVHGSTHGGTRVTRLAVGEGEQYIPLVRRSHEIWRAIERESGADLLTQNGALIVSSPASKATTHVEGFFRNTVTAAARHGIAHELLDAAQIRTRFPQFDVQDDESGYFEPEAGFVRPERAVAAQLDMAKKHGADIRTGETVLALESEAGGVMVRTDRSTYKADKLIVSAGSWLPKLLPQYEALFRIYRQVQFWFEPRDPAAFAPDRFPVFIWDPPTGTQALYGFPSVDDEGFKIGTEYFAQTVDPDAASRDVSAEEIAAIYENLVAPHFPGVSGRCLRAATCLYTVTSDFGFVIDTLPEAKNILLVSACSGHGFKHSAAIGEAAAQWALEGKSRIDLAPFRLSRFG